MCDIYRAWGAPLLRIVRRLSQGMLPVAEERCTLAPRLSCRVSLWQMVSSCRDIVPPRGRGRPSLFRRGLWGNGAGASTGGCSSCPSLPRSCSCSRRSSPILDHAAVRPFYASSLASCTSGASGPRIGWSIIGFKPHCYPERFLLNWL